MEGSGEHSGTFCTRVLRSPIAERLETVSKVSGVSIARASSLMLAYSALLGGLALLWCWCTYAITYQSSHLKSHNHPAALNLASPQFRFEGYRFRWEEPGCKPGDLPKIIKGMRRWKLTWNYWFHHVCPLSNRGDDRNYGTLLSSCGH